MIKAEEKNLKIETFKKQKQEDNSLNEPIIKQ